MCGTESILYMFCEIDYICYLFLSLQIKWAEICPTMRGNLLRRIWMALFDLHCKPSCFGVVRMSCSYTEAPPGFSITTHCHASFVDLFLWAPVLYLSLIKLQTSPQISVSGFILKDAFSIILLHLAWSNHDS